MAIKGKTMDKRAICALAASAFCLSSVANAEYEGKWYLNPAVGYQVFDHSQDLDEEVTWLFGVEKELTSEWGIEFRAMVSDTENYRNSSRDVEVASGGVDVLRYFKMAGSRVTPYAAFGIGHAQADYDILPNDVYTQLNVGGGIRYALSEAWSLRGDARYLYGTDNETRNGVVSLGLSYAFGGQPAEPAEEAPPTPADADGDGVPDNRDRCPNTPAGVAVNSSGCPLDSDGDGVADHKDRCPNTKAGVKVDSQGCEKQLTTTESLKVEINFAFDSAEIQPQYTGELRRVAEFLKEHDQVKAVIEGHADSTGEDQYNKNLSQRRANAVREALIRDYGIPANRLSAVGFGEERPVATNATAEGRAENRRVVTVKESD